MVEERTRLQELPIVEPPPGSIADKFRQVLPDIQFVASQTAWDVALTVSRQDLPAVMAAAKNDQRLAFDFLRCLSGVDHLDELEVVYHLYSFQHEHSAALKVRCPYEDPHVPTVSHLWQTANWLERETAEMFGITFDSHPDPRPLLTEEGLGYYILRKSHPLAEIQEWQEDYLKAVEEAQAQMAVAAGEAPPVDERAQKIALAQQKAALIKKVRDEVRAKGLSSEEERAAVQAAIKAFDEEHTQAGGPLPEAKAAPEAAPSPAPAAPKPTEDRAAKIALAQKKAEAIKKAREEARAQGLSTEEERRYVAEALKRFSAEQGEGQ